MKFKPQPNESKVFWFFFSKKNCCRAAVSAALIGIISSPAKAHAFLDSALPRVGSSIQTAPQQVVLTFTQGVEPDFSRIEVDDASGGRVDDGAAHSEGDKTRLAVPLKTLSPGRYTVIWHVTSVDTHKTQGRFNFTVTQAGTNP
jgi:methionine-rich copper-binding protein CopC